MDHCAAQSKISNIYLISGACFINKAFLIVYLYAILINNRLLIIDYFAIPIFATESVRLSIVEAAKIDPVKKKKEKVLAGRVLTDN